MSSQIDNNNIDSTYPVAGQDNDSQGFRDNFAAIKNNLGYAKSEIEDLQSKVVLKSPLGGTGTATNNLGGSNISNGTLTNVHGTSYSQEIQSSGDIDITNGSLQVFTVVDDATLTFKNWPDTGQHATVRVHLKSKGKIISVGDDVEYNKRYTIDQVGTTNFVAMGATATATFTASVSSNVIRVISLFSGTIVVGTSIFNSDGVFKGIITKDNNNAPGNNYGSGGTGYYEISVSYPDGIVNNDTIWHGMTSGVVFETTESNKGIGSGTVKPWNQVTFQTEGTGQVISGTDIPNPLLLNPNQTHQAIEAWSYTDTPRRVYMNYVANLGSVDETYSSFNVGTISVTQTTNSIQNDGVGYPDTGALTVAGGVGVGKNLNVGENVIINGNLIVNGVSQLASEAPLIVIEQVSKSIPAIVVGAINGTVLTVASTSSGALSVGHALSGTGVTAGTYIISAGSTAGEWIVNKSQTVASSTTISTTNYAVTLSFVDQDYAPSRDTDWTVLGNSNTLYNGVFSVVASTVGSITLSYPGNPGTYGTGTTKLVAPQNAIIQDIALIQNVNIENPRVGDSLKYDGAKWSNNFDLIEYDVTVPNVTVDVFNFNGVPITQAGLKFAVGKKYRFYLENSKYVDGSTYIFPLKFSTTPERDISGGGITAYTTNVTEFGTAGSVGSYIEIFVTEDTPSPLYVYVPEFPTYGHTAGASWPIQVGNDPVKVIADYAPTGTESIIVDTASGELTITLPLNPYLGTTITIVDNGNAGTNNIIIDPDGAKINNDDTPIRVSGNYGGVTLVSDGTNWTALRLSFNGSDDVANGEEISLSTDVSYFGTSGVETATLAAGLYEGQTKTLIMFSYNNTMTITVTNAGWVVSGAGDLIFDQVGDTCTLQYIQNKWHMISNSGCKFGAGGSAVNSAVISVGAPGTASADGKAGTIAYDASYLYVCVATNTWKRVALATWP